MRPSYEQLLPYKNNRKEAAIFFQVSDKTIVRWLQQFGLYQPKINYGPNKLNQAIANEIREKFQNGQNMKNLTTEYNVTFSTISRVIHGIIYKTKYDCAMVTMIYNA